MAVVLFDGECHLCNRSVQFIIKRDPKGYFQFTTLQSGVGKELVKKHNLPSTLDSIVVIDNDRYYVKSDGALHICRHLKGGWKSFYLVKLLPHFIRDFFYRIIAMNRYKWFGKEEKCLLPSKELKKRFLE
ncbi:thiol-disulfide oxidoreductase DCC family protein [Bacillus sp. FJAT-45350]|uniref:thiol-disulfide oxidoreductase DCC family protein n=1 Tax=Bacillus sp. FJAT-45350 TaxID=2011014 RepID=UPI000BB9986D|nr:thiol-disulfide oxidoreductase DCC family protein [Bacillus sp. FJAT-45350]